MYCIYLCTVPPPEVTPQDSPSVSSQLFNYNFTLTCLIELDPAVDTEVEVTALWHGHSLISNSSRVAVSQPAAQPPYFTSLTFSPLLQNDMGTYVVTVQVLPTTTDVSEVWKSSEVHVSMHLSTSKYVDGVYWMLIKIISSILEFIIFSTDFCAVVNISDASTDAPTIGMFHNTIEQSAFSPSVNFLDQ